MCKCCQFREETHLEKTNDGYELMTVKDGRFCTDVSLYRWHDVRSNESGGRLAVSIGFTKEGEFHEIEYETINIKYCPFCGEKL